MTDGLDAHDQARAKLYKAAGWALLGKTSSSDVDMESRAITACRCSSAPSSWTHVPA